MITVSIKNLTKNYPAFKLDDVSFGLVNIGLQITLLLLGGIVYMVLTLIAYKKSCSSIEKIDL